MAANRCTIYGLGVNVKWWSRAFIGERPDFDGFGCQ